jgi:ketosteroid isomerase-like protein
MAAPSIEDWIKINDLFIRYACALDHGEVETVVACFTEDAVIESPVMGSFTGTKAVREFAQRNAKLRETPGQQMRHVVTNLRMDVDGDRARAFCYLLSYLTKDGQTEMISPGEYDCRLVKIAGEWRFAHRIVVMDRPVPIEGR